MDAMTWEELRITLNGISEGENKDTLDKSVILSAEGVYDITLVVAVANGVMSFVYSSEQ